MSTVRSYGTLVQGIDIVTNSMFLTEQKAVYVYGVVYN